jgi:tetratricopeptide (TPR) repeat protein
MLSNVDRFGEDKSFKMTMDERQKTEWTELEKSFKEQLQNPKIVNKFMMLKSLLVLEVLRGEPDMGLAYLEESKKYIKNDVDLYKMLSFGYIPLRKYQKAIPHLKKATELRPNFDDIFALARLQFENHEYEASLATLESLLQSFPDKLDIVFGIVSIQMREGKFKDACSSLFRLQDLYKDEIDMENKDPYFPFYKAICTLVFSKNKDEVKKALQGVIDQDLPWADEAKELMKRFF